jgi:hypothetical protein
MGNFGSKGGLRRITSVGKGHSSDRFVLSDFFRQVTFTPDGETLSASDHYGWESSLPSHVRDEEREEQDLSKAIAHRKEG